MTQPDATPGCACLFNSLPKAGTHLLDKLLRLLPGMRFAGVSLLPHSPDLAAPSDAEGAIPVGVGDPCLVPVETVRRAFERVTRGTFASGHVPYSAILAGLLVERGMKSVLMLRDPRDVAVSHARFVAQRPDHRLYAYYQTLSEPEQLRVSIAGMTDGNGLRLLSLRDRVGCLLPWMATPFTYTTTFERLVGPCGGGQRDTQIQEIRAICRHLEVECGEQQIQMIAEQLYGGTRTFRRGTLGEWREHFDDDHKRRCKELIGTMLVELGYEKDLGW